MARFMSEVNVEFCKEQFTTFVINGRGTYQPTVSVDLLVNTSLDLLANMSAERLTVSWPICELI